MDQNLYEKISENTGKSSIALFINIIIIAIVFKDLMNTLFLVGWVGISTFLILLRSWNIYKNRGNKEIANILLYAKKFQHYSILIAISVSTGICSLAPINLPLHQAFLAMIVAGLSAGAVMSLSYYQTLIRIYLIVLILPFAIVMFLQGELIFTFISLLMLLFLAMLILFSKNFYENIVALIASRNEIFFKAHYDYLTGLANRITLYDRLTQELALLKRSKNIALILFLDIDDFKMINDVYGHYTGDRILKLFAENISSIIREEDIFARLGGDEFVILLSNMDVNKQKASDVANIFAEKIHKILQTPFLVDTDEIKVNSSIGISIIDEYQSDVEKVLNNADNAMYKAKKSGKNQTYIEN